MIEKVEELGRQNVAMLEQIRDLHRENAALRRQLDQARGIQVHEPYSQPPPPSELPPPAPASPAGRSCTPIPADLEMPDVNSPAKISSPDPKRCRVDGVASPNA